MGLSHRDREASAVNVIGYTRVSTTEQADSGLSLDGQATRVAAFCTARGWELVDIVTDAGLSGGNMDRPGLQKVLSLVRRGEVDAVCVLKLDRLTRSVKDLALLLEAFDRAHVVFSSVCDSFDTSTANGRLVLNVLGSVAQWERDIIAERTSDALQVKKAQGRRVGAVPFGFDLGEDGDTLVPDPAELATVADIARWRQEGEGLNAIARRLNALGVRTAQAGTWAAQTVKRILSNSTYTTHVPGFVLEGVRAA